MFWAVLKPLVYLGIYSFFFSVIMPISSLDAPYALVALCGLMAWAYFMDILNSAGQSIIHEAQIIKKNYFPKIVLPVYKSLLGLVEFMISLLIFFIIQIILGHPFQWTVIFIPIILILNFCMGFGLALWTSQLSIRVRDFSHFITTIINFGFWLTPVFYTPEVIPERYRFWIYFNPMAGIIEAYRWVMLGTETPSVLFLIGIAIGCIIMIAGWQRFAQVEKDFVDYI